MATIRQGGLGHRILMSVDRLVRKLPFVPGSGHPETAANSDHAEDAAWNQADLGTRAKPGRPNAAVWLRFHHESRRKQQPIDSLPDTFGGLTGYEDDRY